MLIVGKLEVGYGMKILILCLLSFFTLAKSEPQLGVYAGAPEAHDTVAFEILKNNIAVVTSDYFNADGSKNQSPKKVVKGTWSFKGPFLTISAGLIKDKLRKEDCPQSFPCFKFEKSEGKGLSPLNVPYGFGLRTGELRQESTFGK